MRVFNNNYYLESIYYVSGTGATKLFYLCAKSLQLCPTLCDPMDCIGSSVQGILQARILEWVALSPGDLPGPGIEPAALMSSALAGQFFITSATWEAQAFLPHLILIQHFKYQ